MPGVRARVLDRQPRLVGELAEVHLPRVRRAAQHEDVRAGAEDALLQAGDDDGVDLGMLEADALDGVGELDVDAEIVRVQLQPVVGREAGVLLHVHRQRRDGAVERQLPVDVTRGIALEVDRRHRRGLARELHGAQSTFGARGCQGSIVPYSND